MEHIYYIRHDHQFYSKSLRKIAKEYGHDVKTVKKYIDKKDFSPEKPSRKKRVNKRDKYRELVKKWLEEDLKAPKKQRHTARRVYTRLEEELAGKGEVLDISERTVRTLISEIRKELGETKKVSLPLLHPLGEAQVDFGSTLFYENGKKCEGHHVCITFPYSDAKFVQLFHGENLECLSQGLKNIFEHIGGVPRVIRFDNMSSAVKKIKSSGEREVTEGFRRLQCHYGFESNFCNPAKGNEKGSVENYVGYSRRNYFVPVPEFTCLEEYNKELLYKCTSDMGRVHYKKGEEVKDLFEEEKPVLLSLPEAEFDCCKYVFVKTNSQGLLRFDHNSYSSSGNLANTRILLKVGANEVRVFEEDGTEVVRHQRLYGKNMESMNWKPYLNILAKRPTALKYTGFYESLGEPLKKLFNNMDRHEKKEVLKELAKSSELWGLEQSLLGLERAMELGARDSDTLISGFHFTMNMPSKAVKNKVPSDIPKIEDINYSFRDYKDLMGVK